MPTLGFVWIHTICHRNKVAFLGGGASGYVHGEASEGVHGHVMVTALQLIPQIISFIGEELSISDNDTNLFRQPTWSCPHSPIIVIWHSGIQSQHGWYVVDDFLGAQVLVFVASLTPTLAAQVSLNALLKNLREGDFWAFGVSLSQFLDCTCQ
jgi:hypothetical protein